MREKKNKKKTVKSIVTIGTTGIQGYSSPQLYPTTGPLSENAKGQKKRGGERGCQTVGPRQKGRV